MSADILIFSIAAIGLLAILCQWLAWWVRVPAIVFLLISGIIVGPVLGWLKPDELFGELLLPFISLSVAIILFEGSLTLNFHEISELRAVVRNLVTVGILITSALTAAFAHLLFAIDWQIAVLLGVITSVTGPTVIAPILRTVRPNATIANILRWEGIVIDPIGAVLAVLAYGFIFAAQGHNTIGEITYHFGEMVIVGFVVGVVFGYWMGIAIRQHWLPEFLHNVAVLAVVITVFTISNRIDAGSGLLAVTVMGIWLANMDDVHIDDILGFKESLSIMLISVLFVILAARINFHNALPFVLPALGLLAAIQFIIRPVCVFVCTIGSNLSWSEKGILAWIAPRGIVAAAVSALFALRLHEAGFQGAELLKLLTFFIIIGTVVFQGITARYVARWLKVSEPEPRGFLIVGANRVARTIAKALAQHGYRILLSGLNWDSISAARMEGLPAYYGNPVSEHADRHLDLVGIGHLLALSPQEDLNALAGLRYQREFGRNGVFMLQTRPPSNKVASDKYTVPSKHKGAELFGKDINYSRLLSMLSQGAEIRSTLLTETFGFDDYCAQHGKGTVPLFAIDLKGKLHIFTTDKELLPTAGWMVISLILENGRLA